MSANRSLEVRTNGAVVELTLCRPEHHNSLTPQLIEELHEGLSFCEEREECRVIVINGQAGFFCTGMDLEYAVERPGKAGDDPLLYMNLLKRFTRTPRAVVSKVDGKVLAGGVGLVATSDLVVSSPRSTFGLSEALWGLLPAMVAPFLVRRVGFQPAYAMTLSTETLRAPDALRVGLIDKMAEDVDAALAVLLRRMVRLDPLTIADLKAYFRNLWALSPEVERAAVQEFQRLASQPRVQKNIKEFVSEGRLPWEGSTAEDSL